MIYLDSSALVKRYLEEEGSAEVERLLSEHPHAASSVLAYPEILSALHRKQRGKEISSSTLERLIVAFEEDWSRLFVLEFHDDLLPIIRKAIRRHGVRGADSVHLASALWLRSVLKSDVVFACADLRLLAAAKTERLLPVNPGG